MKALLLSLSLAALSACGGPATPPGPPPAPPRPPAKPAPAPVDGALSARSVDEALRAAWTAAGIVPAEPADDATWLRRVHFDVVGAPPTPEAVLAFLADKSADKRARKIKKLLASPAYVAH